MFKKWIMLFINYSTIKILRVLGTICVVMISFVRFNVDQTYDVEIAPLCQSYVIVREAKEVDKGEVTFKY